MTAKASTQEAVAAGRAYLRRADTLTALRTYRDNLPADVLYDLGIRVHISWGSTDAGHDETIAAVQAVLAVKLRGMIDGIIENAYREERQALADLSDVLGVRPVYTSAGSY